MKIEETREITITLNYSEFKALYDLIDELSKVEIRRCVGCDAKVESIMDIYTGLVTHYDSN